MDRPIHLTEFSICKIEPHREPSVKVPIWVTQSFLDGMAMLIAYLSGLQDAGKGVPPGYHDLWSFYRVIRSDIHEAEKSAQEQAQKSTAP